MEQPEEPEAAAVTPGNADKEEPERGGWGSKLEFVLSSLGFAIGFGNVWRFPYLVYENGGGVFLIPYCICLFFIGLPLFFLEFTIGQYSGYGPPAAYKNMVPIMAGVGFCMLTCSFYVCVYYNVLLAYVIFYLFDGMQATLPWALCEKHRYEVCIDPFVIEYYNGSENVPCNVAGDCKTAGEDYFFYRVLGQDGSVAYNWLNFGSPQWKVVLCLMTAWLLVYLALMQGIQSSGKVVYFTALFPFFVLFVLFCFGLSLDGSGAGIEFYLKPNWTKLGEARVWTAAASQIFFSLGTGFGGLITLSSYNDFNNNCHRDAVFVALLNCATSFFAGFVVFSILGYMAHQTGQKVSEVVASGVILSFVTIPEAVSLMPAAPFWSFLFFLMMITLGLDSMFALMECLMTAFFDKFPQLRPRKPIIVGISCFIGFLLGLSMCAPAGLDMLTLLDTAGANWTLMIVAFCELIAPIFLYGFKKIVTNIEEMGMKLQDWQKYYWLGCWVVIAPSLLFLLICWNFYELGTKEETNPPGIVALGYLAGLFTLIWLPGFAIFELFDRQRKGEATVCNAVIQPTSQWPKPDRINEMNKDATEPAEPKVPETDLATNA